MLRHFLQSNADEVSCSKKQRRAPVEILTRDIGIKRPVLYRDITRHFKIGVPELVLEKVAVPYDVFDKLTR